MNKFRKFSNEEIQKASQMSIEDLLQRQGETLIRSGSEKMWNFGGQKVAIRGNLWYSHYELKGGNAISFIERFMNKNFKEAMEFLLGENEGYIPSEKKPKEHLDLPKPNERMSRVYDYLCKHRKISPYIVSFFANKKMIYESENHHNIVFVGYDKEGVPRHAHIKGSYPNNKFKGICKGSMAEYSFHHIGANEDIYLFEAPVDMLSYITLHFGENRGSSYLASCSVSDKVLFQCLKDYPHLKNVFLCFDNDKAGQDANNRIRDKLMSMGYNVEILIPTLKDWNEDLMEEGVSECQTMEL